MFCTSTPFCNTNPVRLLCSPWTQTLEAPLPKPSIFSLLVHVLYHAQFLGKSGYHDDLVSLLNHKISFIYAEDESSLLFSFAISIFLLEYTVLMKGDQIYGTKLVPVFLEQFSLVLRSRYVHGTVAALKIGKILLKFGCYITVSFSEPLFFHQYARQGGWNEQQPDYFIKAREIVDQVMTAIREQLLEIEKYYYQYPEWKLQVPMSELESLLEEAKRIKRLSRKLTFVPPKRLCEFLKSK